MQVQCARAQREAGATNSRRLHSQRTAPRRAAKCLHAAAPARRRLQLAPRAGAALGADEAGKAAGDALARWLSQWHFDDCGVRVTFLNSRDRFAALATRPVRAGEPLVRVPHDALFTPAAARRCVSCAAVAAAAPLMDWQLLVLALLHERSLGEASAWAPYLAVLPPQDDGDAFWHPLLWPVEFATRTLAGSPMLTKLQSRWATCVEDGALLRAAIAAAAAASPGVQLPQPPSDADVRWASSVLLSRAFYLEDVDGGGDEEGSDDENDEDAEFASYSTLALVPWADRYVL